jgi:hypothetical protein
MNELKCFECKRTIRDFDEREVRPKEKPMRVMDINGQMSESCRAPKPLFYHKECVPDSKTVNAIRELALQDAYINQAFKIAQVKNMNWREMLEMLVVELINENARRQELLMKIYQLRGSQINL